MYWAANVQRSLSAVFRDPAFRYGLKFGLAGVIAVFIALFIQLEEPTWALFTVFVLMIAQYVGAIAEKSVFRIIGTIIGAIFGYVLTASLEQQPILFPPSWCSRWWRSARRCLARAVIPMRFCSAA